MNPLQIILWAAGSSSAFIIIAIFVFKNLVKTSIQESIKHNFNKHLEDYKSDISRELEKLKFSLKNSELLFSKRLEAISKLRALLREIMPVKTSPDMAWSEACIEIADHFPEHAKKLDDFICSYGSILPKNVLKSVESAASNANEGRFMFEWNPQNMDADPTEDARETADSLYNDLLKALRDFEENIEKHINTDTY